MRGRRVLHPLSGFVSLVIPQRRMPRHCRGVFVFGGLAVGPGPRIVGCHTRRHDGIAGARNRFRNPRGLTPAAPSSLQPHPSTRQEPRDQDTNRGEPQQHEDWPEVAARSSSSSTSTTPSRRLARRYRARFIGPVYGSGSSLAPPRPHQRKESPPRPPALLMAGVGSGPACVQASSCQGRRRRDHRLHAADGRRIDVVAALGSPGRTAGPSASDQRRLQGWVPSRLPTAPRPRPGRTTASCYAPCSALGGAVSSASCEDE